MKCVLLAGGSGTRLAPLTDGFSKHLVRVGQRTLLEHALSDLEAGGVDEVCVVLGETGATAIRDHLRESDQFDLEVRYAVQGAARGVADAISHAEPFVGDEPFLVYLGDNLFGPSLEPFVRGFAATEDGVGLCLRRVDDPTRFGVPVFESGSLQDIVEKPADPPSEYAVTGLYGFPPAVFDHIERLEPSDRGELEVTDAIRSLLDAGRSAHVHRFDGWWVDAGTPDGLLTANRRVLAGSGGSGPAAATDAVGADADSGLGEGVRVRAPVSVGAGVEVGNGTELGPNVTLDADVVVGSEARISDSIVLSGATVADGTSVTRSIVAPGARVTTTLRDEVYR
jgi:glucose-1-phosphate thymidylyltransferase